MSKELAKKQETSMVNWDEELAKDAREAAESVPMPGGKFISLEGGIISIGGEAVRENVLRVIVVDFIRENDYFVGKYVSGEPRPPVCFALNHVEEEMAPHELSSDPQNPVCKGCPQNFFRTAGEGRKGKACQNRYRLALLAADGISAPGIKDSELLYLRTPVTSSPAWAFYVKGLESNLHRPPWSVITELTTVKHKKHQFNLTYRCIDPAPVEYLGALKERRKAIVEEIMFPYQPADSKASNKEAKF